MDAFVALGGNLDQTGYVSKDYIIQVLKNEFELEIDLEDIMERFNSSQNEMNFEEFVSFFENAVEDSKSR